jgi:SSS family transporter
MATETMILFGVAAYLAAMIGIGYYASRGSHSLVDFVVAGRSMPLWLCSVTIFATWFGGGTMMGAATAAYESDKLLMLSEPFGSAAALLLTGLFFARILRRTRRMTWPEVIQSRFGKLAGLISAGGDLLSAIIWLGGILFTFGVLLESLTGTTMAVGIFSGLLVVVVYTMIGGMWAVALTDFVQMLIFVVGMLILLVVVLNEAGGWGAVAAQLPDGSMNPLPAGAGVWEWIDAIHVFMAMGLAAVASNSVIQRGLSARTEYVARNAFNVAAIAYTVFGIVPLMLGFAASVLLPDMDDPNAVLTNLAVEYMHPVLTALFIGAILSAIMSTSDSIMLSSSTIISTNFLPLIKRHPSEQLRLRVARYSIPVVGLVSTYIALNASRVVEVLLDSVAVLLAVMIAPFIACFWWNMANRSGALAGMIAGFIAWRVAAAIGLGFPPDLFGFCVSASALVVVTFATQKLDPPRPLTDIDGNIVELADRL